MIIRQSQKDFLLFFFILFWRPSKTSLKTGNNVAALFLGLLTTFKVKITVAE